MKEASIRDDYVSGLVNPDTSHTGAIDPLDYIRGLKSGDEPVFIEHKNGNKCWFRYGAFHREDGPAIQYTNGNEYWYQRGQLHRTDGPAINLTIGTKYWYVKGQLHREDGPAIDHANGTKYWYLNGKQHRDDGPAMIYPTGIRYWFKDGKCHREDGPAIDYGTGIETCKWALNQIFMTQLAHFYRSPYWRTLSAGEQMHYLLSIRH